MDADGFLGHSMGMSPEWNRKSILRFLTEGCTLGEAARLVGVHRQTLLRWRWEDSEFSGLVAESLAKGKDERTFRLWLRHPFRGMRPPTGKGHGDRENELVGQRIGKRDFRPVGPDEDQLGIAFRRKASNTRIAIGVEDDFCS